MRVLNEFDDLIEQIEVSKTCLWTLRATRKQLLLVLETPHVKHIAQLEDDPDVYGELFRVYFKSKILGIHFSFPVADYFFYHEKQYKNRSTYLWHDNADSLEQNFLGKLVTKLMRVLLMTRLRKRLRG